MPERVTKEERIVTLAIEKARIAKEKLNEKKENEYRTYTSKTS